MMFRKAIMAFLFMCGMAYGQSTSGWQSVVSKDSENNMLQINGTNAHFYINSLTVTGALDTTYGGTEDLRFPLSLGGRQTDPPDLESWLGNLRAYAFRGSVGAEQVYFDVQLPHSWDEGTAINPHIHGDAGTSTSTNSVVFKLEYVWANISETFTNTATATIAMTNALNGTPYSHQIWDFPNIQKTNGTYSSMINARLYRDPTDAGDTYTGDIFVHEFDIHYEIKYPGGNQHPIP